MIYCKSQIECITNGKKCGIEEFEYKYGLEQTVYCVYKGYWGKYKVKELYIAGFMCTNIPLYYLSNFWVRTEDDLYDNIDDAINECERRNKRKKYRVK